MQIKAKLVGFLGTFNRLYQFVYGFVFIMLGIILKAWLFVFPMIYTSFVMIALQKRAQGDQIGFNVNMFQNWTTNLIDDTNLFMRLYSSCYAMSKNKCSMENWGAARYSEGSLFRRFVNPKVRYSEHANFLYLEVR